MKPSVAMTPPLDTPPGAHWETLQNIAPDTVFAGNTLATWVVAFILLIAIIVSLRLLQRYLSHQLSRRSTQNRLNDIATTLARKTHPLFLLFLGVYLSSFYLALAARPARLLYAAMILALLAQIAVWGDGLIESWIRHQNERLPQDGDRATTITALGYLARIVMWSLVLLLALDNIGVNITALIAGLGITGIAVALAVQNILGDLFASLSIILDKPFVLGDFIAVDGYAGHIEHIGLKTTRIRSKSGEQIIFSNADLLRSRIRNYKRMVERHVVFTFSVTYENGHDSLTGIPDVVRSVVEQQAHARFGGTHFKAYRDFALDFETEYYISGRDESLYKEIQHAINLGIFRRFHELGIEFAHQGTAHTQAMPGAGKQQR